MLVLQAPQLQELLAELVSIAPGVVGVFGGALAWPQAVAFEEQGLLLLQLLLPLLLLEVAPPVRRDIAGDVEKFWGNFLLVTENARWQASLRG